MSGTWEATWELSFPAETKEQLLLALVVRDLIHGTAYDVEVEDEGLHLAIDLIAGDEIEDSRYQLVIVADVEGPERHELVQEFVEQVLEETVEQAEALVEARVPLGSSALDGLEIVPVTEEQERWDLIIPDWMAPDGSEVPFGFRSYRGEEAWPSDEDLDAHGRVVLVPFDGEVHLYGIPAPTPECECDSNCGCAEENPS
jgi:hypothetical protein